MNKYLFLLSTFILISCNTQIDQSTQNRNYACAGTNSFAPLCMADLDWEIITNYNDEAFPLKVSMSLGNQLVLNECSSKLYPFEVNRGSVVLIEATNYIRTDRTDLEIEIKDCTKNKTIFYNEKQTFSSSGRKLIINLRSN